jgi:hypothetical protein
MDAACFEPIAIADNVWQQFQNIVKDLSSEKYDEFRTFIEQSMNSSEECPLYFLGIPCADKAQRTAIHNVIKSNKRMSKHIDSDTQQVNDVDTVRLIAKHQRKGHNVPIIKVPLQRSLPLNYICLFNHNVSIAQRDARWIGLKGLETTFTSPF